MLWTNLPEQEGKDQGVQFLHVFKPYATLMHKVNTSVLAKTKYWQRSVKNSLTMSLSHISISSQDLLTSLTQKSARTYLNLQRATKITETMEVVLKAEEIRSELITVSAAV